MKHTSTLLGLALAVGLLHGPAARAAQVAGGGIGAVIAPAPAQRAAPAARPAEAAPPLRPAPAPTPATVRPWGGLKLDLNPFGARRRS